MPQSAAGMGGHSCSTGRNNTPAYSWFSTEDVAVRQPRACIRNLELDVEHRRWCCRDTSKFLHRWCFAGRKDQVRRSGRSTEEIGRVPKALALKRAKPLYIPSP